MLTPPIVFVDDDLDDLEAIETVLTEIGTNIPTLLLTSGTELLNHLRTAQVQPSLIVSDINMPGNSGFKTKEIINTDKSLVKSKQVPFVFWSTSDAEVVIKKAYEIGAKAFFTKPTSYHDIGRTLKCLLDFVTLGAPLPSKPV